MPTKASKWISKFSLAFLFFVCSCGINEKFYSISDINADNYIKLLRPDHSRSLTNIEDLTRLFEYPMILVGGRRIGALDNWTISSQQINDGYAISYLNEQNGNYYIVVYANDTSNIVTGATVANMNSDHMRLQDGESKLQDLLTDKGFTYSKSELKRSNDIIIKEHKDVFVIGDIVRGDDNEIMSIRFDIYSRRASQ